MQGSALHPPRAVPLEPEANVAVESMQICSGDANTRIANISLFKGSNREYSRFRCLQFETAAEIIDTSTGAAEFQTTPHAVPTPAGVVRFVVSIGYLHHSRQRNQKQ